MAKPSMFVGMDVHKESIDISLAEEGRDGESAATAGSPATWRHWRRWSRHCAPRRVDCVLSMRPVHEHLSLSWIRPATSRRTTEHLNLVPGGPPPHNWDNRTRVLDRRCLPPACG